MITLWRVPLAAAHALPAARAHCLDDHEVRRKYAFADPDHGLRWQLAHVALREILGAACHVTPAAVRFSRHADGKSTLETDQSLRFSLSHAPDIALIAVGAVDALGVDVEQARPVPGIADVLRDVFTAGERESIAALDPDKGARAFLRGWTRKEAVVKALGRGIETMSKVEVTLDADNVRVRHLDLAGEDAAQWSVADLHLEWPFVGALAVRGQPAHYEMRDWTIS